MKISFTKMSGAGNDFVVVDNRKGIIKEPHSFAVKVCDRRHSIGADGLLLLESSDQSSFSMKYYNADGSNAGMCGNGGRCLAKFAFERNIVSSRQFEFEAFGHIYKSDVIDHKDVRLTMKNPENLKVGQIIESADITLTANYLNTGTDHSVIFLNENKNLGSLETIKVDSIGQMVRYHKVYQPKGTNVNFVKIKEDNSISIRTYERGVEAETLACGTGSVASALVGAVKYNLKSPIAVSVKSGEILTIDFERENDRFYNIRLTGSAVVTFTGEIEIN